MANFDCLIPVPLQQAGSQDSSNNLSRLGFDEWHLFAATNKPAGKRSAAGTVPVRSVSTTQEPSCLSYAKLYGLTGDALHYILDPASIMARITPAKPSTCWKTRNCEKIWPIPHPAAGA